MLKYIVLWCLLLGTCLAENTALQPNIDSAPIRIAWADTREKGSAMFQLVGGRIPDLVGFKFKNVSGKDVTKVESEVTLQHKESGIESVRKYTASPKKVVLNGKDGKVDYEDMGVYQFRVRQIRPTKVYFADGSEWAEPANK